MQPKPNIEDIKKHLQRIVSGGIHEIRFLPKDRKAYPENHLVNPSQIDKAAETIVKFNEQQYNCYVTLNPLYESVKQTEGAAKDTHVCRRRWFYVDVDADKAISDDIMATDTEHEDAIQRARAIQNKLSQRNWPQPIVIDSGNGAALLYQVDLPNDEQTTDLFKRCLTSLNKIDGQIDVKVYNAARIARIVGTVNRKGKWVDAEEYDDQSQWRPWRAAGYLSVPDEMKTVTFEQLYELAEPPKSKSKSKSSSNARPQNNRVATSKLPGGDGFAKKLFWAMYFKRFGEDLSGTERALAEGGFSVLHSDGDGVFIQSRNIAAYSTAEGDRDVKVYSPYLNLSTFHKSDEGAGWTWEDGMEYAKNYLPSFWSEYEQELENSQNKYSNRCTSNTFVQHEALSKDQAQKLVETNDELPGDDELPGAGPGDDDLDVVGKKIDLIFHTSKMPRFILALARMIQQRSPIVTDLGAMTASISLASMALGKSATFIQQGNRRYASFNMIYGAHSGAGKSDLCRTAYYFAGQLGIAVDQSNDINIPTFFKHYGCKVELEAGTKPQKQRDIMETAKQDDAICLIIDEFRNFLDNMIGSRHSQGAGYVSKLCNILDDELILTYETKSGGNLWIGDPCIKLFGACVSRDLLGVLQEDVLQNKGLTPRLLVASEMLMRVKIKGKYVLTSSDKQTMQSVAQVAQSRHYIVAFDDAEVEQATKDVIENVSYIRSTLNRLTEDEKQAITSKAFTQAKKIAATYAVLDWLWNNYSQINDFDLSATEIQIDGNAWLLIAMGFVLAIHCSSRNDFGNSDFAEARKLVLHYLWSKRGDKNIQSRRPSIILNNRRRLAQLGFRRTQDFKAFMDMLVSSGDVEMHALGEGRYAQIWYDPIARA